MQTVGTWWLSLGFVLYVLSVLTIDILILGRKKSNKITIKQALFWTVVWACSALLFGCLLWLQLNVTAGPVVAKQKALEYFTGYIVEQSLSIDNLFVFIMIFKYFIVPHQYQRRVLLYGVMGAIILRLIMIVSGTALVAHFHWVLYLFGLFLVFTGIKMLWVSDEDKDLDQNPILRFVRRHVRVTNQYHGEKFFIKKELLWYATPLFLVVIMIELSDVIFALDSIPAIFALTSDPFIIFTSNIFAIMGLRAVYFVLAYMEARFYLLRYGIAVVLTFVGAKMLLAYWYVIPTLWMLVIVVVMLSMSIILSLLAPPKE